LISITTESNQVERDKPVYAFLYVAKTGVSIKEMQMYRRNKFDICQNSKDFLVRNFSILLKIKNLRMKKIYVFAGMAVLALGLTYCSSSKKAAAVPKTTYTANVSTVIAGSCSPCHIPSKGGNKKSYDNYANVKADIDSIIRRIELNPTDRGFMPFKKEKLPADVIAVFKKFKEDGALEN
jgi:hypothetical protein